MNDEELPSEPVVMRRMGMNLHSAAADRQTYRENTIASFRRAAAAGASFVEFDVQVHQYSSFMRHSGRLCAHAVTMSKPVKCC